MIDCTCGSRHFVLGGFQRILDRWLQAEPGTNIRELVQRTLKAIHGVDLNPFAVAIARFRLLVAALEASGVKRLKDAPNFHFNLAVGDSLLHGTRPGDQGARQTFLGGSEMADPLKHVYETEDRDALRRILGQRYHAVVGNPPYITVKDNVINEAYRERFASCHRQYSLAVPFMERFFDLAIEADSKAGVMAGYVGMITASSFMKREFGKKLIGRFIPTWDLTHVVDTAGAYIPGCGTPTVILFGRNQRPVSPTIRTVMGIKGEPAIPADPAMGLVWTAIVRQVDQAGSQGHFVSVTDAARTSFHTHPWNIGGGGAAKLKEQCEKTATTKLGTEIETVCSVCYTRLDEVYLVTSDVLNRARIPTHQQASMVSGNGVRDWCVESGSAAVFPYKANLALVHPTEARAVLAFLWPYREDLWRRKELGGDHRKLNRSWWEWNRFLTHRFITPFSIAYAEIATHNNFAFDRGGKVFTQTSPTIKPKLGMSENDCLELTGLLNSSVGCFWLKQTCFPKGGTGIGRGIQDEAWEGRYAFDGTKIRQFPIPPDKPRGLAQEIDRLAQELKTHTPVAVLGAFDRTIQEFISTNQRYWIETITRMITLQEELDWECYRLYGILEEDLCYHAGDVPPIQLGERAFEIVMARQMAAGELETTWFTRHGSTPITEPPSHWAEDYRRLVEQRIEVIESNPNIALIEKPEYKRRWNVEPWDQQLARALREWLLNRLEDRRYWAQPEITSAARLADQVRQDAEFMQVAELYRGRPDFDVPGLLSELVQGEGVPILPIQRYKATGLRKREAWEQVWDLQRQEDAIDAEVGVDAPGIPDAENLLLKDKANELKKERIGDIPVPPKYASADFKETTYWRLRGKLDVPKERFILFPGCGREADPTPVFTWAGWDHVEQARAIAGYYEQVRNEGWSDARRVPLLAAVLELVPWLKQWHNTIDPAYGIGMGDFFEDFIKTEARAMGKTVEDLRKWTP